MIQEYKNLTIIRKKGNIPLVPFLAIKEKILGKKYNLTLIFCSLKESQERNATYRDKNYPTNILSFPLEKTEGEIYISLSTARLDAKNFSLTPLEFTYFLFIHGCLHLLGLQHGSKMEELEDKYLKEFLSEKK